MISTTEEFCHHFYTIEGNTVAERRKALFQIFKKVQNADINFESIQPSNYLGEIFKLETLIYFQHYESLIEYLTLENPILNKRILRNKLFFKDGFDSVSGEDLVTKIFPSVSYSTKIKIIIGLSRNIKDSRQADEYFKWIENKYGIKMAKRLLNSCSFELIMDVIKKGVIVPTTPQVLLILKRYPDQQREFLELLGTITKIDRLFYNNAFEDVFKYLALKNTDLYIELTEKYEVCVKLSQKETRAVFSRLMSKIISEPETQMKRHKFNIKSLRKSLKTRSFEFCSNLLPHDMHDFPKNKSYLPFIRGANTKKFHGILQIFEKTYGKNLQDFPDLISEEILQLAPLDWRHEIVIRKTSQVDNEEELLKWIPFLDSKSCIDSLKQKIRNTSESQVRSNLIYLMVKSCRINNDKMALAEVCKYVAERHRNDRTELRQRLLNGVKTFDLKELDQEHWKYINDLLKIFEINGEYYFSDTYIYEYIRFQYLHGQDIKPQILKILSLGNMNFIPFNDDPLLQKEYLLTAFDLIPTLQKEHFYKSMCINFLKALCQWNRNHPAESFYLLSHAWTNEILKEYVKEKDDYILEIMNYIFISEYSNDLYNEIKNLYLNSGIVIDKSILKWLIIHQPYYFLNFTEPVFKSLISSVNKYKHVIYICKQYSHLRIPEKLIDLCNLNFKEDKHINSVIQILSQLLKSSEYTQLISKYYPQQSKIDTVDENFRFLFETQTTVANTLQNLIPTSSGIDSILKFCEGDYLKISLRSLYSITHHTAERKLPPVFDKLLKSPVSVRKHAFYLMSKVLSSYSILELFDTHLYNEKDDSLRKCLLFQAFTFFIDNPNETTWHLLETAIKNADFNDQEIWMKPLSLIEKIPVGYLIQYIIFLWELYENKSENVAAAEETKGMILRHCNSREIISSLPEAFCENVITHYFLNLNAHHKLLTESKMFTIEYLLKGPTTEIQEMRLQKISNTIGERKKSASETIHSERKFKFHFLHFTKMICENKVENPAILRKIGNSWLLIFNLEECFEEVISLNISCECEEYSKQNISLQQFATNIFKYWKSFVVTYGNSILYVLKETIEPCIFNSLQSTQMNIIAFIKCILDIEESIASHIFVIHLLPSHIPKEFSDLFTQIIYSLRKSNDSVVQIHLNNYLKSEFS